LSKPRSNEKPKPTGVLSSGTRVTVLVAGSRRKRPASVF
jgi:hypothetical protein